MIVKVIFRICSRDRITFNQEKKTAVELLIVYTTHFPMLWIRRKMSRTKTQLTKKMAHCLLKSKLKIIYTGRKQNKRNYELKWPDIHIQSSSWRIHTQSLDEDYYLAPDYFGQTSTGWFCSHWKLCRSIPTKSFLAMQFWRLNFGPNCQASWWFIYELNLNQFTQNLQTNIEMHGHSRQYAIAFLKIISEHIFSWMDLSAYFWNCSEYSYSLQKMKKIIDLKHSQFTFEI